MDNKLVPFKSYLAPKNATHKKIHVVVPNKMAHKGKATIAITKEAFWIVAPSGEHIHIPFSNIKDVKTDNFPGIIYQDEVDGIPTYVAPNDTAGVTVEYNSVGRLTHRVSFLTHLPNDAHTWVRLITEAIDDFYKLKLEDPIVKDDE